MSAFACGRCDECDGGRGYEYCLKPRGDPTFRCACGRVGVVMECDRCAPHPDPELVERLTRERDQALARVRRITTDVLTGLSAAGIATPELGYEVESWAISGDIDRLAKERDEWKARAEKAEEALAVQVREWRARVDQAASALSEIIARQKAARAQGRMPDVEYDHAAADEALLACLGDDEVRDQFAAIEMWYA